MPRVSVVMPVYNRERFLGEAIASILGQTYADLELIVVDDGSSDRSPDIISEYAARDARVVPVYLQQNVGRGAARNRGIERASGEYIAGMDSDDISLPDRLQRQVDFLDAQPEISLVSAQLIVAGEDFQFSHVSYMPLEHPYILWSVLFLPPGISGPTPVIRRGALEAVGGFYEGELTCEDTELFYRLLARERFACLDSPLYIYRQHPQMTGRAQYEKQKQEGIAIFRDMLIRLWGEVPPETFDLFVRFRWRDEVEPIRRAERKALRAELVRLIDSLVADGWVEADERPVLEAEMERKLNRIRPQRRYFWRYLRYLR